MAFLQYYEHSVFDTLSGDQPPFTFSTDKACNIAAAAGNMWSPRGPADAVILLCRHCYRKVETPIQPDESFQAVADCAAKTMSDNCRMTIS